MPGSATPASAYGRLDRLLHRVALGSGAVAELSFDIERARFGRAADALRLAPPIFVTGLARAGTTILTRLIAGTGGLATPSYRDLPFPLAPNLWARCAAGSRRQVEPRERGHGDGLMHDLDSAEAIEEVFWRVREGERYHRPEGLAPVPPEPASLDAFERYVRLVCLSRGQTRYLSKNNNNVLRIAALVARFPGAVIVHPFRDPLEQAGSLLAQHRRALELARGDRFRASFMRWLGHHEFGAHQRPFAFPDAPNPGENRDALAYWLRAWISVHQHLLAQPDAVRRAQCFIPYERLVRGDRSTLGQIADRLSLAAPIDGAALRMPSPHRERRDAPPALVEAARAVHMALLKRSL